MLSGKKLNCSKVEKMSITLPWVRQWLGMECDWTHKLIYAHTDKTQKTLTE